MHPTKFLGCNSWTLPFPIPAGAPGPAGLQSARSRAGPASQDSGFCPLDFQRTLGCLGNPRRLGDFSAEGWSGKGLDPKGEAFLRPPGGGAPRMCQQRAEYVVPCSTQSQCPDPWSAPLRCAHWMPILGDPGAHEMGVPSRNGDPREHKWEALPHPCQEPTPAETGPRPAPPGLAPPLPRSLRVPSRSGDPREHNWDRPPPKAIGISTRAARVYPVPGALPARFQPQCPPPRAQLGSPPPPPPEADPRPTPPAFAPPLHGPGTFPASSVHARVGAGCRSMGDVSGA